MTNISQIKFLTDEQLDQIAGGFTATDDLWVKNGSGFIAWEDIWPGVKSKK